MPKENITSEWCHDRVAEMQAIKKDANNVKDAFDKLVNNFKDHKTCRIMGEVVYNGVEGEIIDVLQRSQHHFAEFISHLECVIKCAEQGKEILNLESQEKMQSFKIRQ